MCDHENGLSFCQFLKSKLNLMFIFRICKSCRLVQNDDRRILKDRSRQSNTLIFSTRQISAAISDNRVQAVWQTVDDLSALCCFHCTHNFFPCRSRFCCPDIFKKRVFEQFCILEHKCDLIHQRLFVDFSYINAACQNASLCNIIKTREQLDSS